MDSGKISDLMIKLLITLLIIGFEFVVFEAVVRIQYFGYNGLSKDHLESINYLTYVEFPRKKDESCSYIQPFNSLRSGYFMGTVFETNSLGLRDKEYSIPKEQDKFRIRIIGNSITMGQGVPIEDVYHSVFEDKLNELTPEGRFEVINLGYPKIKKCYKNGINDLLYYDPDLILMENQVIK